MLKKVMGVVRRESPRELGAVLGMGLSFPVLLLGAMIPSIPLFAAAAAVGYVADAYLYRRDTSLAGQAVKFRTGLSMRFLARELLLVLLLARLELADSGLFYAAVACFLGFFALQGPLAAVVSLIERRRKMSIVTRNIHLGVPLPDAPPHRLVAEASPKSLHLDVIGVVGVLVAAATDQSAWGYAGLAVMLVLATVYLLALVPYLSPRRRAPASQPLLDAVNRWLGEYKPGAVLYYSGSKESTYQANMWLETMSRLDVPPLVILREKHAVVDLAPTDVPVICVPSAVQLMNMDLSTVRVALYPGNVGKNIHLLRLPTMKHVFIGHGDSDKIASINPYCKVYDEVWTAGRAGRDRWSLADVGVRDESVVEVGRPQLAPIETGTGVPEGRIPTVLYAPTWEGWTDEPGNTSLILAGENIVRRLLKSENPVRVLYKPHPFTGIVSPKAKAAHQRISAMIRKAAVERAGDPRWAADAARLAGEQAAAKADLVRIEERLAELQPPARADEAESVRESLVDEARSTEAARLRREWNDAYWKSFGFWEHRIIGGSQPALFDCFNVSDGMVSDISSVVSDYIASGKPYAVTDSAGLGEEEFKRRNTAVRAAVVLSNSAEGVAELVDAVSVKGADALVKDRMELRQYLLGPVEPPSMVQFNDAVNALAAKSAVRNAGQVELVRALDGA
ncbi:hypothetical protein AB0M28_21360 [Streptomyces sp. NPDC051940]|uniref:hypothetical protein n=1 Tax=Streptomyces sp. NPDC051940 TaxID=3155675 RepID=UPI0034218B71